MKPHVKRKNGQYYIFSSLKASKDCMPQYTCNNLCMVLLAVKQMNEVRI